MWNSTCELRLSHVLQTRTFRALVPHQLAKRVFLSKVTPVACFAAGRRTIRKCVLLRSDVRCRKLLRTLVGTPRNVHWSYPWRGILHAWNECVRLFVGQAGVHFRSSCGSVHRLSAIGGRGDSPFQNMGTGRLPAHLVHTRWKRYSSGFGVHSLGMFYMSKNLVFTGSKRWSS